MSAAGAAAAAAAAAAPAWLSATSRVSSRVSNLKDFHSASVDGLPSLGTVRKLPESFYEDLMVCLLP